MSFIFYEVSAFSTALIHAQGTTGIIDAIPCSFKQIFAMLQSLQIFNLSVHKLKNRSGQQWSLGLDFVLYVKKKIRF